MPRALASKPMRTHAAAPPVKETRPLPQPACASNVSGALSERETSPQRTPHRRPSTPHAHAGVDHVDFDRLGRRALHHDLHLTVDAPRHAKAKSGTHRPALDNSLRVPSRVQAGTEVEGRSNELRLLCNANATMQTVRI